MIWSPLLINLVNKWNEIGLICGTIGDLGNEYKRFVN